MKAVTYSRYSTDQQSDSSIDDQQRVCAEYAKKHGMRIVEHFADAGISGAARGNRPALLKMIKAAENKQFDVLLMNDQTRLSRSADLSQLVVEFRHAGIRVVGCQDGFDSDSEMSDLNAGLSGVMSAEFRRQISRRTRSARNMRAQNRKPVGGKAFGYTTGDRVILPEQAEVVRRVFNRFVDGASTEQIATELNADKVPSPGSYWTGRTVRRASGWMCNGVRSILQNELYCGRVTWNKTIWSRNPTSGARECKLRPQADWITYQDDALRIISDELWSRAQARFKARANPDQRIKSGGKARYVLSGLLRCSVCGAHYILCSASEYRCSGVRSGACTNRKMLSKERAEAAILGPIRDGLLSEKMVAEIAKELQAEFNKAAREDAKKAKTAPAEVQALDERIARLRTRLKTGDPDMTSDEIQAAIAMAQAKRSAALPTTAALVNLTSILPKAAARYRAQIDKWADGNPIEVAQARTTIRELIGGKIDLVPERDGSLWAVYGLQQTALLAAAGHVGSGGRI